MVLSGLELFFFQLFSLVSIKVFTGEDPRSESLRRDESNRIYWFLTEFLSLVNLKVVFIVKVQNF